MSQLHPYIQSSYNAAGPLYQYLHHQQPAMYHNYMYPQEHSQPKRY